MLSDSMRVLPWFAAAASVTVDMRAPASRAGASSAWSATAMRTDYYTAAGEPKYHSLNSLLPTLREKAAND